MIVGSTETRTETAAGDKYTKWKGKIMGVQ